ncbi:hypothetical protein F5J12DRAFT_794440 [Pisolithus orientalis]|uniref:uncharacterized protein n=1 Tax=Pisolithus orientalis TaxID=936130 RepID=UPI002225683F|nr:uncharacterized protein F5J12DRAFT_794440 [Pisolithus orientalis]KAI6035578.1 hypothetical protein F5J12DRAFT_794440 [Pisolithus orientalis]
MSSWSAPSYPLPPRRSRSRSPPRGAYVSRPPYPDPVYFQDHRGGAWDPLERDRAWNEYDRDRATYDYARRGRSRSPPPSDDTRKRRRSMSPYDRERYDPRPRYGDDYDAHNRSYGYRSPPRAQFPPAPYPPSRRAPPDPRSMDHPATLKQYAEWFRYYFSQQAQEEDTLDKAAEQEAGDGSKPRNGIRSRWEKYKKEFFANQLQTMFDHHRKSPWFAEKYDPSPEFVALRRRVRKEGWKGKQDLFLHDLEAGKYDPDLNESESELSVAKEGNTSGGLGDGTAPEEAKNAADDDMQFNMDAEEDGGDHEANRAEVNGKGFVDNRRGNRGEEISVLPEGNQVMIRTIPPDIGRLKLEEACNNVPGFMYLALGDPLQKRNFYRAGWIRFRDDADMTAVMNELTDKKIEGFKLHVTHNTKPFVNRVRYVPEVAGKPDRIEKDLANAKVLASILEDEAAALRKSSPSSAGGDGMDTNGDGVSEQVPIGDAHAGNEDDPEPKEGGSQAVERRIEKILADLREQGVDEKTIEAKKPVISLDLYLAYLRAAYHTCYYCAVVTDHAEELQRKCLKHVRKPLSKSTLEEVKAVEAEKEKKDDEKETDTANTRPPENRDWKRNDERWLEWFDSKIALLINRAGVDPRDYGGKSFDDELSKAVEPYIKQEDEGRFRCKTCQKLFKATSFVEKHIANKHPELVRQLDEVPYFNNFALDPHRIQPFAHPPPATGNNQAPPQAYGIQGPTVYPPDYGRPNSYYGVHPPTYVPPPPYVNAGYWDHYGYQYGPAAAFPPVPPRREEVMTARRLSDRISGYAMGFDQQTSEITLPVGAGLPPKPAVTMDAPLDSGHRKGGRRQGVSGGPPPPPPPDAREDPRAAAGKKVSYHDMDLVAEGDVELTY